MDTEHTSGRMGTVPATKFVVLLRVSTKHQGADGLGIAAQKRDIELFLSTQQGAEVIAELTEVESGGSATRPVLEEALHLCRINKATLLVQKVDRLSRDLETLARIVNREWGTVEVQAYSQHPDHSAHVIEFYTNPGDLMLDCMSGRGTNLLVGAALGRRVVGYDMNPKNFEKVRSVAFEHTDIDAADLPTPPSHNHRCDGGVGRSAGLLRPHNFRSSLCTRS